MPEVLKSPAFVISGQDLGESDRLITFYTLASGKARGIAKGAKRSRRRFVNALEPFTLIYLCLVLPRTTGLNRIDSTEIVDSFPFLRHRIDCYVMASLCCELVNLWTREGDPQEDLFRLLRWYFDSLKERSSTKKTTLYFKTKLLALAGYAPNWDLCLLCKKPPNGARVTFRLHDGGFVCSKCRNTDKAVHTISLGTLRTLGHIQKGSLYNLHRLSIADAALEEAWSLIRSLHCHHLQRTPASYEVLSRLGRGVHPQPKI